MKIKAIPFWNEIVGIIEEVRDNTIIFRDIGGVEITSNELISKANKNIGKKVSILRTDLEGKEYLLREVVE